MRDQSRYRDQKKILPGLRPGPGPEIETLPGLRPGPGPEIETLPGLRPGPVTKA